MKPILIFAGTTEGRRLSECLAGAGISHTVCVATEYGEIVLKKHPLVQVHRGRMDRDAMAAFVLQGDFMAVVDATHPYARAVTENIKAALKKTPIPYLRLKRDTKAEEDGENVTFFESSDSCAKALESVKGNILLTTGSKELAKFCVSEEVKKRLYVRVLPGMESLALCMEQGIVGKQILAMQGPFSEKLNEALIEQFHIACLVTKQSGSAGGFQEKIRAAKKAGILAFVIGQPEEEAGDSFETVCRKLEEICQRPILKPEPMEIVLAGIGMGNWGGMTGEVQQAIEQADVLMGAKRMLDACSGHAQKYPCYLAERIIPCLERLQSGQNEERCADAAPAQEAVLCRKVAVLFSGDSGFYSGCQKLYQALCQEIEAGRLMAKVRILPGISSVSCLAACTGKSWQDSAILSLHGKALLNLAKRISREKKTFLLLSGLADLHRLGEILMKEGLEGCKITAGYQLSYPEQEILTLSASECCSAEKEGLYTCLIENPFALDRKLTHGMEDGEFIREKVPMTKQEVRQVSICKLKLHENAVVYDVGSGTGSVAVEIAGLSENVRVYALEKKTEAVSLIEKNRDKFGLENIFVISGEAPDIFDNLPMPTHAFIGGSSGRMREILAALYEKNPHMRVVINAVSLETIAEIKEVLALFPMEKEDVVQLQVSRTKKAGAYHLMQAENPVWICAFTFCTAKQQDLCENEPPYLGGNRQQSLCEDE